MSITRLTCGPDAYEYLGTLVSRVDSVLRGHILWICTMAKTVEETSSLNYLPPGRRIGDDFHLLDVPSYLVRLLCCLETRSYEMSTEAIAWVRGRLRPTVSTWIRDLHVRNRQGTYTFPKDCHVDGKPSKDEKYSLVDHVMIALAIKCVERLGKPDEKNPWPYYSYHEVRRKILKRFTTENPFTNQRMLATTRWVDRTRFLLHSKDSALFTKVSSDFFEESDDDRDLSYFEDTRPNRRNPEGSWRYCDKRWMALVRAQGAQKEVQNLFSPKTLWYALVFAVGCRSRDINSFAIHAWANEARTNLLDQIPSNGLFPGIIDYAHRPLILEDTRDQEDHFLPLFEIPNLLLHYDQIGFTTERNIKRRSNPSDRGEKRYPDKVLPFNVLDFHKNPSGLVVVSDDWLKASPVSQNLASNEDSCRESHYSTFTNGEQWRQDKVGVVIDVPKWSTGAEISAPQIMAQDLSRRLMRKDIWEAKKIIVWLPKVARDVVDRCLEACSQNARENLETFARRHQDSEKYFLDSVAAKFNEWETELHLSFFRLSGATADRDHTEFGGKQLASVTMSFQFSGDFCDRRWKCYFFETGTTAEESMTLGNRLQPENSSDPRDELKLLVEYKARTALERRTYRDTNTSGSWQQRRVLELLMFSKILMELNRHTTKVFNHVRALALQSEHDRKMQVKIDSSKADIDEAEQLQKLAVEGDYFSISARWRSHIQTLLKVEENLSENLEEIQEWNRRDGSRLSQKPRWTQRDEQNHRTSMLKLTTLTHRQTREIERLKSQIKTFREALPTYLESLREDISFRGSQNMTLFTYVTVVFLPLGFATGVLSMSGAPDDVTLKSLITLSLGALGLTLFALLNAEFLKKLVEPMVKAYRYIMRAGLLARIVYLYKYVIYLYKDVIPAVWRLASLPWPLLKEMIFNGRLLPIIEYWAHREEQWQPAEEPSPTGGSEAV